MSASPGRTTTSTSPEALRGPRDRARRRVGLPTAAAGLVGIVGLSLIGGTAQAQEPVEPSPVAQVAQVAHVAQAAPILAVVAVPGLAGMVSMAGMAGVGAAQSAAAPAKAAVVPARAKAAVVLNAASVARHAARRPSPSNSQAYAATAVRARGWGKADYQCLVKLWTKESRWNHKAMNRSSGAYGIPQSLPGGKMASAGKNWRTDPGTQIRWGLGYIKSRYGTPCAAWRHSQASNWY